MCQTNGIQAQDANQDIYAMHTLTGLSLTVTAESEGNVTCMIVQYKKNRIVVRWFARVMNAETGRVTVLHNTPVFREGLQQSNCFQVAETSAIWDRLTYVIPRSQEMAAPTCF